MQTLEKELNRVIVILQVPRALSAGSAVLCGVVGAVFCLQGHFEFGIVALVCTCGSLWYYHSVHQYIKLTKSMVLTSTMALEDKSQFTRVLAVILSFQVVWLGLGVFAALTCLQSTSAFGLVYLFFSHYWTSGVLKGLLHVAVGEAFACLSGKFTLHYYVHTL